MGEIYEYRTINVSLEPSPDAHGLRKPTISTAANRWAQLGWRTVAVMPSAGSGYADAILIERKREDSNRTPDPHLVRDIVNVAVARYGTGWKHGDWVISAEHWQEIVYFVVQEVYDQETK